MGAERVRSQLKIAGNFAGLAEATDAVVRTPLEQLETWQTGRAELPPVVTTIIRGVPVRTLPAGHAVFACRHKALQLISPARVRPRRARGCWRTNSVVQVAILRPMIGATEAVSAISVGVRKSFAD